MVATANPFHYGSPATGDFFTGREEEVAALVSRMRDNINVVVLSPRRYGKTSLVLRAEGRLRHTRPIPAIVHVNALRCKDAASLAEQLLADAFHSPGGRWHRAKNAVPEFLRRIRATPSVAFDIDGRPTFSFSPGLAGRDADTVVADVYELLAEAAANRPAVLVIDEFQAVADLDAHLPGLLKGLADQYPGVSLVAAGSRRHLMEQLFLAPTAVLYGMAQKLALAPLPDHVMASFLIERSTGAGKPMDEAAAGRIVEAAGPVPNDIQQLAYETFETAKRRIDVGAVDAGLARAVAHEASTYAERFMGLSPGQRRVLVQLADDPVDPPFSGAFARAAGLANGASVKRALEALEADELVLERDGRWVVADRIFAEWLRPGPGGEPRW